MALSKAKKVRAGLIWTWWICVFALGVYTFGVTGRFWYSIALDMVLFG